MKQIHAYIRKARPAADIAAEGTVRIQQIGPAHPDQEDVFAVIGASEPPRRLPGADDVGAHQLAFGWKNSLDHCFSQYNTLLPVSRELSPSERRPRSALPTLTWITRTSGRPGCTTLSPGASTPPP